VVLVPLDRYNALLDRLEDLEDVVDMLEALKEPRRPLAEYLAEVGAKAGV
jgi:PHD/YefM family antitoxin component YafN of YafNO toxin-antitoxin module